jgi:hypothetical protein
VLVFNPEKVLFAGVEWEGVESIGVDRLAHKLIQEWSDDGAAMVFADVPEQKVRVVLVQRLEDGALVSPVPGDSGTLSFEVARSGSDAGRVSVSMEAVVAEVRHDMLGKGGRRSMVLWAVSSDGATDPVSVGSVT